MHIGSPKRELPWATVVGVVPDTKLGARDQPSVEQWSAPAAQPATIAGPGAAEGITEPNGGYIVLRSALIPEQMTKTLHSVVAEIEPLLALGGVRPVGGGVANADA